MIQVNGLLSTWAFLLSKNETALLEILAEHLWFSERGAGEPPTPRAMFDGWLEEAPPGLTGLLTS
jgi:hypothetical protein